MSKDTGLDLAAVRALCTNPEWQPPRVVVCALLDALDAAELELSTLRAEVILLRAQRQMLERGLQRLMSGA